MASSMQTKDLSSGDVWKKKLCRNFKVLVHSIDVSATVDDLLSQDVLNLEEKEVIENANPNTTYNKSRIIIKLLLHKTEEGFEIFLKSLEENGHEEIASQVKNTDIHVSTLPGVTSHEMLDLKRRVFRNFDKILSSISLSYFLDDFVSHGVFGMEDMEVVLNTMTTSASNREFLNILLEKDDGFQLLLQLIEAENMALARKINDTNVDGSVDNEILCHIREIRGLPSFCLDKVPQNVRTQAYIRLNDWKTTTYVEVQASESVFGAINNNTIVTVTGNPGTGKSATIHHVALRLAAKGFDVLPVDSLKEIKSFLDPAFKQVFVLDDPIGVHSLEEDELGRWVKFNATLKCLSVANTKILCSIRKALVNEVSFKVNDTVLNKNIIDLQDSKNSLRDEEKIKILEQHIKGIQYNISTEMKSTISDIKDYFPLMCKLFASNEKFRELGFRFFLEPFDIIKKELDGMQLKDKLGYCTLILCFFEKNSLSSDLFDPSRISDSKRRFVEDVIEYCGVSRMCPLPSFKEQLKRLESVFLKKENNCYRFVHDMIYDVVAYHFGSKYPEQIIKHSSCKFIRERVVVSQDHVSSDNEYVILLDKHYFPVLVERLLNDIKHRSFYNVFRNKCWDDFEFMESFIEVAKEKRQILEHEQDDIIKLFCSEQCEDDIDDLEQTKAVDTWTWYWKTMSCLRIKGTTLLHWVVAFGHKHLFEFMWRNISLERKKKVIDKVPLIHFACMGGNIDICEKLLQLENSMVAKPLAQTGGFFPLHYAVLSNPCIIDFLIDHGADVNVKSTDAGRSPILFASGHGNIHTVRKLISHNADINTPDSKNVRALWVSCQNGHQDVCKLLIGHGADIDLCKNDGTSPLFISCCNSHANIIQLLLDHGADVNLCDNYGASPLYISSQNNHSIIVKLLLDHGADVNLSRNTGASPLYISSQDNHSEIVQLLLDHGADVNRCTVKGHSPLIAACYNHNPECTKLLLDTGKCLIDHQDKYGETALFIAAEVNDTKSIELLIKHGCDVNIRNKNGKTALEKAKEKNSKDVIQILKGSSYNE